jgi:hypothetical protein
VARKLWKSLVNFRTQNWRADINTHVKHETQNAPQGGRPARIGQTKIKKLAGRPAKQISESGPAHGLATGPAHDSGNTPDENHNALADLVWKYFADEITRVVIEVQEALGTSTKRLSIASK